MDILPLLIVVALLLLAAGTWRYTMISSVLGGGAAAVTVWAVTGGVLWVFIAFTVVAIALLIWHSAGEPAR